MSALAEISLNLLKGAERRGADPVALLRSADLPRRIGPSSQVQIPQFVSLVRATTRALDDEALGLLDRRQRVGTFAILAAFASNASTIGQAFERSAEFMDLQDNSLSLSFEKRANRAVFSVSRRPGGLVLNELGYELVLILIHRLMGWLGGVRIPIMRADFSYSRPPNAANYPSFFTNAALFFECSTCCLSMPADFMSRPVLRSEQQAMAWARRTPLDAFLPIEAISGLALDVAMAIERHLDEHGEMPDAALMSHHLGMAPHTLRRRLQAAGSDYRTIRTQVRRDRAIRLLNTTNRSIEDISELTGFSEASAFIRAFKSWTGITPRNYRVAENT